MARKSETRDSRSHRPLSTGHQSPALNTLIVVWHWTSISVITSLLLVLKVVSMATDGHDGKPEHWQILYTAALQELSIDKLPRRIRDAEREIADEIKRSNGFQTDHQPLLDALGALRDLETISQALPLYASGKS